MKTKECVLVSEALTATHSNVQYTYRQYTVYIRDAQSKLMRSVQSNLVHSTAYMSSDPCRCHRDAQLAAPVNHILRLEELTHNTVAQGKT